MKIIKKNILNRVIPCEVFLKRLRIRDTDHCPLCQVQVRDSIAHFLFNCETVRVFWRALCSWFNRADNLYLDKINTKEFVFGLPNHKSDIINTILMYTRSYIHRQKFFDNGELDLLQWLGEFREKLKVEKWISTQTGKLRRFSCGIGY